MLQPSEHMAVLLASSPHPEAIREPQHNHLTGIQQHAVHCGDPKGLVCQETGQKRNTREPQTINGGASGVAQQVRPQPAMLAARAGVSAAAEEESQVLEPLSPWQDTQIELQAAVGRQAQPCEPCGSEAVRDLYLAPPSLLCLYSFKKSLGLKKQNLGKTISRALLTYSVSW